MYDWDKCQGMNYPSQELSGIGKQTKRSSKGSEWAEWASWLLKKERYDLWKECALAHKY